jgi:two-component system, chemotaxis family, chemotaxis protein CheY
MRVLTVDDSRTILAMLHHTLSNAGFEVIQAENGQVGLDLLASQDVDVVITDINMPVMDGIESSRCAPPANTRACPS